MHGYQLVSLANDSHIPNWTDVTVGAIYGALKRLLAEGFVHEVRVERNGARPVRQVLEITDTGRNEVHVLRMKALTEFRLSPDPFDLAFARPGELLANEIPGILQERLKIISAMAVEYEGRILKLKPQLTGLEELAMIHRLIRIKAEVEFLKKGLATLASEPLLIDIKEMRES
ncbi:hypothetical protein Pcaca04_28030 [Pectobacterium carotovorum subsp. carotovorum]|nr:hypothetical protein Pcaca04_28030 [Pectobacterium carotovorum subsp. carotovorum]